MLRLPPFTLHAPRTVEQVADLLASEGPAARLLAGGTDLLPNLKRRHQRASVVLGLARVEGLRGICVSDHGELVIGAMTTLAQITRDARVRQQHPAFWRAIQSISSPVLRSTGTLGGNLCLDTRCTYYNQNLEWRQSIQYCLKAEGDTCWVAPSSPRCWAISASDSAPLLSAVGARVRLVSKAHGVREIDVYDLFRDDGIEYLAKRPDELLTEVRIPPPGPYAASHWKLRRRGSIDYSVLTVGAAVWRDGAGRVERARIHLGAVNSLPSLAVQACAALVGHPLDAEIIAEAARRARQHATPMDNTDFLARWRGHMVEKYVEAALREIAGLPVERLAPRHA